MPKKKNIKINKRNQKISKISPAESPENIQLKIEILEAADLIISSVNWVEKEIQAKMDRLDYARENFLLDEETICEKELESLILRLSQEIKNMDDFLFKYRQVFADAKSGKLK